MKSFSPYDNLTFDQILDQITARAAQVVSTPPSSPDYEVPLSLDEELQRLVEAEEAAKAPPKSLDQQLLEQVLTPDQILTLGLKFPSEVSPILRDLNPTTFSYKGHTFRLHPYQLEPGMVHWLTTAVPNGPVLTDIYELHDRHDRQGRLFRPGSLVRKDIPPNVLYPTILELLLPLYKG